MSGIQPLTVGESAPEFQSKNQFGEPVGTAELSGKPALIMFYPYAFTGICTGELTGLNAELAQFAQRDTRVLAVSCDSMFSLRVFADQEKFGFDLVTDHWPHGEIARGFGVLDESAGCAIRGSFLLDPHGVIRWSVINQIGDRRDMSAHVAALDLL